MSARSDGSAAARWGVHGHEHVVAALARAAGNGTLAHAYLLRGPEGVGKATVATRLAQSLLCEGAAEERPCLECRSCRQVATEAAPDIERVRVGGACDVESHADHEGDNSSTIRICQVRRLQRLANLTPFQAPRRIFILDTADDLQTEAANALLKTLEEPPAGALLLLLSTDPDALLPTIRSRCQELDLRPLPRPVLAAALEEERSLDADEAARLAALARGRYGLALRLHDDDSLRRLRETAEVDLLTLLASGCNERFDHVEALARRWRTERASVLETLDVWLEWWRQALGAAAEPGGATNARCTPAEAVRALQALKTAREHLLANTNPQLVLEVLMLDLPQLDPGTPDPGTGVHESREEARATA